MALYTAKDIIETNAMALYTAIDIVETKAMAIYTAIYIVETKAMALYTATYIDNGLIHCYRQRQWPYTLLYTKANFYGLGAARPRLISSPEAFTKAHLNRTNKILV